MGNPISRSLPDVSIDSVFTEVQHNEKIGLRNPEQLRLFRLQVSNNAFIYTRLEDYLTDIISEYVFSRAQIEELSQPGSGNPRSIGMKALRVMKHNGAANQKGTGNELGEILLYAFLEEKLNAPKIFSKVELNAETTPFGTACDCVHLLDLSDNVGMPYYQTVFGISDIEGDIADAIDKAFDAIMHIENENGSGIQFVDNRSLDASFDEEVVNKLTCIIIPEPGVSVANDRAYGVFLGYSLGLDPHTRSTPEFLKDLGKKMDTDIKNHAEYIADKIKKLGLDTHSFYFYIVPFNDAKIDKQQVMENLLM